MNKDNKKKTMEEKIDEIWFCLFGTKDNCEVGLVSMVREIRKQTESLKLWRWFITGGLSILGVIVTLIATYKK